MSFATEFFPASLVESIGEFKNLMEGKCQKGQEVKIKAEIFFTMPIIVLDMIALVF